MKEHVGRYSELKNIQNMQETERQQKGMTKYEREQRKHNWCVALSKQKQNKMNNVQEHIRNVEQMKENEKNYQMKGSTSEKMKEQV